MSSKSNIAMAYVQLSTQDWERHPWANTVISREVTGAITAWLTLFSGGCFLITQKPKAEVFLRRDSISQGFQNHRNSETSVYHVVYEMAHS